MRPPVLRLSLDEKIVDCFAGGGGASTGITMATGREPDVAINHDREALAVYAANHKSTRIFCEDVFTVTPRMAIGRSKVGLAWFSPDCTFFSKARGARPHRDKNRARRRRGLAGVVLKWAAEVRPRVIFVENVEEFRKWGPLGDDGQPDPARVGESFQRWRKRLLNLGYAVEYRELRACDYGAPTSRKRLFIIARCDGEAIVWPEKSHGPGRELPYRTAAECIDWSIPCPSIFGRKKPLAEATLRRIARGIQRYVLDAADPFIVPYHAATSAGGHRIQPIGEPLPTQDTSNRYAVVDPVLAPILTKFQQNSVGQRVDEPTHTVMAGAQRFGVVVPTLINTRNGEREGQAPRVRDIRQPAPTVTSIGSQGALVAAFLAQHNTGMVGHDARQPVSTIVGSGKGRRAASTQGLVTSHLLKLHKKSVGAQLDLPLPTVRAQGTHLAEVRAFLVSYYSTDQDPKLRAPAPTLTTKHRLGLVTIHGIDYAIVDIGMRMLQPRELFNAQGFPPGYVIDPLVEGKNGKRKKLTKTGQVHKCGNSVCPPAAEAIVRAQFEPVAREMIA